MYLHITYQHDLHIGNRKLNPYPFRNINSFFNNYNHLYWYQTIKSYSYINFLIPILSVYILIKIQTNYFLLIIKNTIGSKKFPPTNKNIFLFREPYFTGSYIYPNFTKGMKLCGLNNKQKLWLKFKIDLHKANIVNTESAVMWLENLVRYL